MIKIILLFLACIYISVAYQVGVDLNTFSTQELNDVISQYGHVDFTWAITVNSPGVSQQLWRQAFASLNNKQTYSQDNPMEFRQCAAVRQYSGTLTAAFGYHEAHVTQLNYNEISQYSDRCLGVGVVILTRAYWPNSDWKNNTDAVLHHPKLYGVAMEFNPNDFGKRSQADFVRSVLAAGKTVFFLLPFRLVSGYATQNQISDFIKYLKNNGINMGQDRLRFVLARYDKPYVPVIGGSNSIRSALLAAQRLKQYA